MLSQIVTYSVVTDSDICSEIRHNEVAHIGTSEQFATLGHSHSHNVLKSMKCIQYNHAALSIKCYTALGEAGLASHDVLSDVTLTLIKVKCAQLKILI